MLKYKSADSLAQFEQVVLTAVHLLRGEGYSVTITDKVGEIVGKSVSQGAVYSSLERLVRKELCDAWFVDPNLTRGGYSRRCFKVTEAGGLALAKARKQAQTLADALGEFA